LPPKLWLDVGRGRQVVGSGTWVSMIHSNAKALRFNLGDQLVRVGIGDPSGGIIDIPFD